MGRYAPAKSEVQITEQGKARTVRTRSSGGGTVELDPLAADGLHPRIRALEDAFLRWSANRDRPVDTTFPVARFLLLHTLSHLLIRQVALECGYGYSSIRERLHVGTPTEPATGILLSTAARDSESTLGGLVTLADPLTTGVATTP